MDAAFSSAAAPIRSPQPQRREGVMPQGHSLKVDATATAPGPMRARLRPRSTSGSEQYARMGVYGPETPPRKWERTMMKLAQCARASGLTSSAGGETASSTRAGRLLSSYLLNLHRGSDAVMEMVDRDRRFFLDLGAGGRAADLEATLRLFLSYCPEARRVSAWRRGVSKICPQGKI